METKKCPTCKEIKDINLFYKNKYRKDGIDSECKICKNKRTTKFRKNHKDLIKSIDKKSYYKNHDKKLLSKKKYWAKNREKLNEKERNFYQNNKELILERQRIYHLKHKEKRNLSCKKRYEENPMEYILRAKERKISKRTTSDKTITVNSLKLLIENQNYKCVYCSSDLRTTDKHLDHIIPISKGGIHSIKNVQWVCKDCNLSKSDNINDKWKNNI
jgi:5-methylcytosine-specific restriction endonuclease McrA